jgi:hypothetical protein
VLLCEDLQSQVFLRRSLIHQGVAPRKIHPVALPSGKGAGSQYVIAQYPRQVEAYRSRAPHMKAALVVHVDADPQHTVADRHRQLNEALQNAGQPPRGEKEHVAHLVPKRNIETWIHFYLDGPPVDEETEYTKYPQESACWPAAEKFSDGAAQKVTPVDAPPSLVQGLQEFQRVLTE